jgi:hypothetical protein
MVISVKPGVYLKGQGGFRHSDTVLVTQDSHEYLTRYDSDIKSLTIRGWKPMTRLKGVLIRRTLGLNEKAALGSTGVKWAGLGRPQDRRPAKQGLSDGRG